MALDSKRPFSYRHLQGCLKLPGGCHHYLRNQTAEELANFSNRKEGKISSKLIVKFSMKKVHQ